MSLDLVSAFGFLLYTACEQRDEVWERGHGPCAGALAHLYVLWLNTDCELWWFCWFLYSNKRLDDLISTKEVSVICVTSLEGGRTWKALKLKHFEWFVKSSQNAHTSRLVLYEPSKGLDFTLASVPGRYSFRTWRIHRQRICAWVHHYRNCDAGERDLWSDTWILLTFADDTKTTSTGRDDGYREASNFGADDVRIHLHNVWLHSCVVCILRIAAERDRRFGYEISRGFCWGIASTGLMSARPIHARFHEHLKDCLSCNVNMISFVKSNLSMICVCFCAYDMLHVYVKCIAMFCIHGIFICMFIYTTIV